MELLLRLLVTIKWFISIAQLVKDPSDLGSVPTPFDISSRQSQASGTSKTRNINLLELKMMAANRALKSSNDLLRIAEPKEDFKISPIYETRSEGKP